MRSAAELKKFVRDAVALLARERDLAAFEVYCSTREHRVARLNYTSDIPSRGVEEFKSSTPTASRCAWSWVATPHETGSASAAGDLSLEAIRTAIQRARVTTVIDPHFSGLPTEPRKLTLSKAPAGDLIRATDGPIAAAAWQLVGGAISAFAAGVPLSCPTRAW